MIQALLPAWKSPRAPLGIQTHNLGGSFKYTSINPGCHVQPFSNSDTPSNPNYNFEVFSENLTEKSCHFK